MGAPVIPFSLSEVEGQGNPVVLDVEAKALAWPSTTLGLNEGRASTFPSFIRAKAKGKALPSILNPG